MIVSGEASGDLHGGALAEALFSRKRPVEIVGFGGKAMRAAGVDVRFDIKKLGIVGIIEVFFQFRVLFEAYRTAVRLLEDAVDLLVLIDFSGFNLRIAKAANRLGIPVVYYVSPQVWAWRSGRVKTIAKRVDKMLVILPFEKPVYDAARVPCEFVGHPLLDEFERERRKQPSTTDEKPVEKTPVIALLPGSRSREVVSLLPDMLAGVEKLLPEFPALQVLIPVANSLSDDLIPRLTASVPFPVTLIKGTVYDALLKADVAVVASGTATLQGALAGTPMVVVYKVSWLSYGLAKLLVRIKWVSMVNIVAGKTMVSELIQSDCTPEAIAKEVGRLLRDDNAREAMRRDLSKVAERLGKPGASERAAAAIFDILDRHLQKKRRVSDKPAAEARGAA